jgi:nicotinate-nucleotide adenylyltransferase
VKLGILGGSFNPVHLGHLFLADKALVKLKLDRIVMIPAFISPFKPEAKNMEISASNRIEMLCAAVAGDIRLAIDDCEIKRQGVSYTVDTLEDIIARYIPDGKPYLIIGDDLAEDFPKWKDSKKIMELADIVIACRLKSSAGKYPFPHILIDNEIIDISSQTIRKKISENSDWRSLVPSAVRAIIEDRRLYAKEPDVKKPEDANQSVIIRVESAVRETLNLTRFLHSRNTALLAADLCGRFGLDPDAGYLAGIAHDFCKQLEIKQMIKLAKSDGKRISALEKGKPGLLHGRAAAVLLRERFCIHNKDILEAVAVHTSGSENMGPLAKVIYIADKVEVSRNIDSSLRKMCYENDLDDILLAVLKKTITKLQSKDMALSLETVKLLEKMKGRNN